MKRMLMLLTVLSAAALLPAAASATHWDVSSGGADCTGWNANFNVSWLWDPSREVCADVTYVVELIGPDGTFTRTVQETLCQSTTGDTKSYAAAWGADYGLTLNGTYTATITFTMSPDYGGYADVDVIGPVTFTCGTPQDACHYTPGYWKNHPENWPVQSLTLGGRVYSEAELLVILDTPVRKDATIILAYHTIAAKLNVLAGANGTSIAGALATADAIFAQYGIGNGISGAARAQALDAKDILAAYNELECGGVTGSTASKSALPEDESATWGGLKTMFR